MDWSAASTLGGAAIGAIGSYFSGKSAQDFAKESYKKRYQWQVQDLKKAGLNPMLAVSQGAPSVPSPSIPNIGEATVKGASAGFAAAQARRMNEAQIGLLGAQESKTVQEADKAEVETKILEAAAPFSASKAESEVGKLQQDIAQSKETVLKIQQEVKSAEQLYRHQELLYPLVREYQAYQNKAAQLGLTKAKADEEFWKQMEETGKYLPIIIKLVEMLSR